MKCLRIDRPLVGVLILLAMGISTNAQIAGGLNETTNSNMGGNHFIVGTVFWPSGKPVNVRLRLKLVSMTRGEVIATTDQSGRFVFSRVGAGSYSIVIDREDEFDAVTQTVDVEPGRTPQTYSVSIRLSAKSEPANKPSVLDARGSVVPRRALELFRNSLKRSASKDHKGAIVLLRQAIEEYPDYEDALNEIGVQYMLINDLQKADEELAKALKLSPNSYAPLINRAITLFRQKKFDEADKLLRSAMKAKPTAALPYFYLGRSLTSQGLYDEGEKALRDAIKIGGGEMLEAYRMLANLYIEKGDDRRAAEELKLYLQLVPNAPDAIALRKIIQQLTEAQPK